MADFVRYELEDGTEVLFEAAEGDLVSLRGGGEPDVAEGGVLGDRLNAVARAADEVASGLRARLAPDQVQIEFSVKIAAEVNWWFFSRPRARARSPSAGVGQEQGGG